jgi:hypothetical protein
VITDLNFVFKYEESFFILVAKFWKKKKSKYNFFLNHQILHYVPPGNQQYIKGCFKMFITKFSLKSYGYSPLEGSIHKIGAKNQRKFFFK